MIVCQILSYFCKDKIIPIKYMDYSYVGRFVWSVFGIAVCLFAFVSCSDDEPFSDNNIVVPPTTDTIPAEGVVIGDENLRAALLALLQTDELTTENLETVTILSLRAKNYVSQEILRRFTPQNDNRVIPSEGTSPTRNP